MNDLIQKAIFLERLGFSTKTEHFISSGERFGVCDMVRITFFKKGEKVFQQELKGSCAEPAYDEFIQTLS